jgi:hypothetical protein
MIGSTMVTMLRIGVFLLFALANYVRICNITILVEIASAKNGTTVAFFATSRLPYGNRAAMRAGQRPRASATMRANNDSERGS